MVKEGAWYRRREGSSTWVKVISVLRSESPSAGWVNLVTYSIHGDEYRKTDKEFLEAYVPVGQETQDAN